MLFSAKLIFDLRTLPPYSDEPLKEERIVLIDALDEASAQKEAIALGKRSEHQYVAADGGTVSVIFLELRKIYWLNTDKIENYSEVYSEYFERGLGERARTRMREG
jgi:Domain of unknown function (DUF4288)